MQPYWIWYPGDFSLYHALRQNFSRVERGFGWPAFWRSEPFRQRVAFRRTYHLTAPTAFTVYTDAVGYVMVQEEKYPFGVEIPCPAGTVSISIHAGRIDACPAVYIQGDVVASDEGWMVEDYAEPPVPAGHSKLYTRRDQDPTVPEYTEQVFLPVSVEEVQGGTLYGFATELTAVLEINAPPEQYQGHTVYCGETREEALAGKDCYHFWQPDAQGRCPRCALRYVFIPGPALPVKAIHQFIDIPVKASFQCGDPLLEQIWQAAAYTFQLCSGLFFIDGIKRDQWIWSGDAYQSFLVNRYLLADAEVDQRTMYALRGRDPMTAHINTILDYSLLWVLGVWEHYSLYQDRPFLQSMYPKMQGLVDFCCNRTESHGFLIAKEKDWTYVDWADLDKDGPLGAEQMLLAAVWDTMAAAAQAMGDSNAALDYQKRAEALKSNIDALYWDPDQGAYIDSYTSGRRHVSRQTNIFALRSGIAAGERAQSILQNVLLNPDVPAITTPYFQFYELEALAELGQLDTVLDRIRSYWGGMLDMGAVTIWEEYKPDLPREEQYGMYGDPFGKSLCHAWGASPIYLLSKYFIGLRYPGGAAFELQPHLPYFPRLDIRLPIGENGWIALTWDGKELTVRSNCSGRILWRGQWLSLPCPDGSEASCTLTA